MKKSTSPSMHLIPRVAAAAIIAGLLAGCSVLSPLPRPTTTADRLAMMPGTGRGLDGELVIRWDRHQIPAIVAQSDRDLAYGLGLVHAHLRLGQIELFRHASQGRLSEAFGPFAITFDKTLRTLDWDRNVPQMVESMPPETREFVQRFADGLTDYQNSLDELPIEHRVTRIRPEPFTVTDIATMGRMASADLTWLYAASMVPLESDPGWPAFWADVQATSGASIPTFGGERAAASPQASAAASARRADTGEQQRTNRMLAGWFYRFSRTGSNALAIGQGWKGQPAAMLASDPHISLGKPSLFLIVRMKSPSYDCLGMMFPGLPIIAIGRNRDIAWGGTNMISQSSDIVRLPAGWKPTSERTERIRSRFFGSTSFTIRESAWGPVLSDLPFYRPPDGSHELALRWMGHQPSEEFSALFGAMRARNYDEFRSAFRDYSVPGQNFLMADRKGGVGLVMGVRLPDRTTTPTLTFTTTPEESDRAWKEPKGPHDLPSIYLPSGGLLVNTNNAPSATTTTLVSRFLSSNGRQQRFLQLLEKYAPITPGDMTRIQLDQTWLSAGTVVRGLVERMNQNHTAGDARDQEFARLLSNWDGDFAADSRAALAAKVLLEQFVPRYVERIYGRAYIAFLEDSPMAVEFIARDLRDAQRKGLIDSILAEIRPRVRRQWRAVPADAVWGDRHRLVVQHPFGAIPIIGGKYRAADVPIGGAMGTIWKTATQFRTMRHRADYGQNARAIFDLSDADSNYLVLLTGQDGWLRSTNDGDMLPVFLSGQSIRVPMTIDDTTYPFETRVQPLGWR